MFYYRFLLYRQFPLRAITSLAGLFLIYQASGQQTVNTTGTTVRNNSLIVEYSVGEISTTTLASPGNTSYITQGVLQIKPKLANPGHDVINDSIHCYPNPSHRMVSIETKENWIASYQIYNIHGKQVATGPYLNNQIDMHDLPGGTYFIRLYPASNDKFRVIKVIKQ